MLSLLICAVQKPRLLASGQCTCISAALRTQKVCAGMLPTASKLEPLAAMSVWLNSRLHGLVEWLCQLHRWNSRLIRLMVQQ